MKIAEISAPTIVAICLPNRRNFIPREVYDDKTSDTFEVSSKD
jgi:hypothetical protein